MFNKYIINLNQGFPKGGENQQGGETGVILKFVAMNLYQIFMSCRRRAKKMVLGVNISNFETYTRYCRVAGEENTEKRGQRWLPV